MSDYITLSITRSRAKQEVVNKLLTMSDNDLERIMDQILKPRFCKCSIVEDYSENDDFML